MKLLNILLSIAAILLIQTQLLAHHFWTQYIDLFLLLNVYVALNTTQLPTLAVAIFSGLVQDSFSQGIIGMNAFSKAIVAYLISSLSQRLMIKHPLIIMLLVAIASCADYLIIFGLHQLFGLKSSELSIEFLSFGSAINSLAGLILFQIVERVRLKKEYA